MNRWLDREVAYPGPMLTLCLNEKEYLATMRKLRVKNPPPFTLADASTHTLDGPDGVVCVVCLDGWEGRDPVEVAGLLVHEAVHVWQDYCASIGEQKPAIEQEAYGIQALSQRLMGEFARRVQQ